MTDLQAATQIFYSAQSCKLCSHSHLPRSSVPALAEAKPRENKFRMCFWIPFESPSPIYTGYQFGRSPSAGTGLEDLEMQGEEEGQLTEN